MHTHIVSTGISAERLQRSQSIGDHAELVVAPAFFSDLGWAYKPSPARDNRIKHYDFIATKGSTTFKVEVKAHKVCRNPQYSHLSLVLLEHTGIAGYPGWLRGEADVILQVISDNRLIAYRRTNALAQYKELPAEILRCSSTNPPIGQWFGRHGMSRSGFPNRDIIRWEEESVFIRAVGAITYTKQNNQWMRSRDKC